MKSIFFFLSLILLCSSPTKKSSFWAGSPERINSEPRDFFYATIKGKSSKKSNEKDSYAMRKESCYTDATAKEKFLSELETSILSETTTVEEREMIREKLSPKLSEMIKSVLVDSCYSISQIEFQECICKSYTKISGGRIALHELVDKLK
ncbi:MAG: hypothetical protein SFU98_04370 [Leptospiraceae bacterium]|nr:hypothetical protein [Leptospiraceae bacterium]